MTEQSIPPCIKIKYRGTGQEEESGGVVLQKHRVMTHFSQSGSCSRYATMRERGMTSEGKLVSATSASSDPSECVGRCVVMTWGFHCLAGWVFIDLQVAMLGSRTLVRRIQNALGTW